MEHINFKWQRQILKTDLQPNGKYLMLTLSTYLDKTGKCWPSMRELSDVTGLSFNTVKKYIRLAIKKKVLRAENAGLRGSKSKQLKYYPILNEGDCQPLIPSTERLSNDDERLSTVDRETVNSFDTKQTIEQTNKNKPKRGKTPAPTDFEITDNLKAWAKKKGFNGNLPEIIETCFDHFRSEGKKKTDWEATIRNWIRRDMSFKAEKRKSETNKINALPLEST